MSQILPEDSPRLPNVYRLAAYLAQRFECKYIVGIGYDATRKLVYFHPDLEPIGLVHPSMLASYSRRYPVVAWKDWVAEREVAEFLPEETLRQAIIVCSDVAHRLQHPNFFLQTLKNWLGHSPVCILTGARVGSNHVADSLRGRKTESGNTTWFQLEELLRSAGLNIEFSGRDPSTANVTWVSVITNTSVVPSGNPPLLQVPSSFKVVAFMAAYNEEDIIVESIRKWTNQGVAVHILENWSTDGTFELIKELETQLPVTVERFPSDGPSSHFDWGAMLTRFEALAKEIEADWFVRRGADEVLMSPWPGVSYREGLYLVDQAGYNCVDHTVINFHPIDDGFQSGVDHERYFRHYTFGTALSDFQQIKTWKNYGQPISMQSGGHQLGFEGRRVYPFKFLLKHYPVRSQQHGMRKVFQERKTRWVPEERAVGWHTQYDEIRSDHVFVRAPSRLIEFDEGHFNKKFPIERLSGIGLPRVGSDTKKGFRSLLRKLGRDLLKAGVEVHPAKSNGSSNTDVRASNESIFSEIYRRRGWGECYESVSGQGSGIERTAAFRDPMARLFSDLNVRSVLDAGCGDFNWMRFLTDHLEHYTGIDVVPELIAENQIKYGQPNITFLSLDITMDSLSQADLILSRDCLVHLSCHDVFLALQNFKRSGSKYLLTNTFLGLQENTDISTGDWRRLNLQLPPFSFPEPIKMIDEKCLHTGGIYRDKRLALWELKDLPD